MDSFKISCLGGGGGGLNQAAQGEIILHDPGGRGKQEQASARWSVAVHERLNLSENQRNATFGHRLQTV